MIGRIVEVADDRRHLFMHRGHHHGRKLRHESAKGRVVSRECLVHARAQHDAAVLIRDRVCAGAATQARERKVHVIGLRVRGQA